MKGNRKDGTGKFTKKAEAPPASAIRGVGSAARAAAAAGIGARGAAGAGAGAARGGAGAGGAGGGSGAGAGTRTSEETGTSSREWIDPTQGSTSSEQASDFSETGSSDTKAGKRGGFRPNAGRPAGTFNAKTKSTISVEGVEGILLSIHMMLASIAGIPELELPESEARRLGAAWARVMSFYQIEADPKTIAWINLFAVGGSIYGTHGVAFAIRKRRENEELRKKEAAAKKEQAQQGPSNVYPFAGAAAPASGGGAL